MTRTQRSANTTPAAITTPGTEGEFFGPGSGPAQAWEVSDLIYHLMVVLEAADQPLADVYRMLAERRGQKK